MKYFVLAACLFVSGWLAAESIDETLDAASATGIDINNLRGSVSVEGWAKSQVRVIGKLGELADELVFKLSGNEVLVHVNYLGDRRSFGNSGSKLKILVPKSFNIEYQGVSSDLSVAGIDGSLEVASVSGNLRVNNLKGELSLNSVNGKIDLKNIVGPLSVTTVSGDVVASVISKDILVNAISADINVTGDEVLQARLSNVSGDTVISAEIPADGDVFLSNVSGESVFRSVGKLNAKVIMQTGPGGDIENRLTDKMPTVSFIRDKSLDFTSGNGSGLIKLTTVSGTISIF